MSNKRTSELTELSSGNLKPDDLFMVTDTAALALESKKIKASSIQNYILNSGAITGSISHAFSSDTSSYLLYTGIPNGTSSNSISSSYSISSSWSNNGYWAKFSDSASYISSSNVKGTFVSCSYSDTSSFLNYRYNNGRIENSQTASYCENSKTSSYLFYTAGVFNGTASYALSASSSPTFNGTSSYLSYSGTPNGTASFALNITNPEITSSYLRLVAGRVNGTASYAISSSWASSSFISSQSYFLRYSGNPNGTASYALNTNYCDFANISNTSLYCSGTSSFTLTSSISRTASFCTGTSSYAATSSRCTGTSSYALSVGSVNDSDLYRIYGPYNSVSDPGGTTTATDATVQYFSFHAPSGENTTALFQAFLDVRTPVTQVVPSNTVEFKLDSFPAPASSAFDPNPASGDLIDTSRPVNYISLVVTGSITLSGYSQQSSMLGGNWYPVVTGSYYRVRITTAGGALIETTRGVTFFVYTKSNTSLRKQTTYP